MASYLYEDIPLSPNLDHPDSAIRLASCVHRFKVPKISAARKINFAQSFDTVGQHPSTRRLMLHADDFRKLLQEACDADKVSAERVVKEARRYTPLIHSILTSCKVQPENARLDEKLMFEWTSGIESSNNSNNNSSNNKKKGNAASAGQTAKSFVSEAIMYDLTMSIACEGLGRAASANLPPRLVIMRLPRE